jgi:hypothetical protein
MKLYGMEPFDFERHHLARWIRGLKRGLLRDYRVTKAAFGPRPDDAPEEPKNTIIQAVKDGTLEAKLAKMAEGTRQAFLDSVNHKYKADLVTRYEAKKRVAAWENGNSVACAALLSLVPWYLEETLRKEGSFCKMVAALESEHRNYCGRRQMLYHGDLWTRLRQKPNESHTAYILRCEVLHGKLEAAGCAPPMQRFLFQVAKRADHERQAFEKDARTRVRNRGPGAPAQAPRGRAPAQAVGRRHHEGR